MHRTEMHYRRAVRQNRRDFKPSECTRTNSVSTVELFNVMILERGREDTRVRREIFVFPRARDQCSIVIIMFFFVPVWESIRLDPV